MLHVVKRILRDGEMCIVTASFSASSVFQSSSCPGAR